MTEQSHGFEAPVPGTRRARRAALTTVVEVPEVDAQDVETPAVEALAPTRRQLREQRDAARPDAGDSFSSVSRRELRERRLAENPLPAQQRPTAAVAVPSATAAEVVARALGEQVAIGAPLTSRKQVRAALRQATVEAPPEGACLDNYEPQTEESDLLEDVDHDLASVAMTLSRLAVVATSMSATAEESDSASTQQAMVDEAVAEQALTRRARRGALVVPSAGASFTPIIPQALAKTNDATSTEGGRGEQVRQWVPRLAVLTALGAATVVTPIQAWARVEEPPPAPPTLAQDSALDTLAATPASVEAAAATTQPVDQADTAALLASDQLAETRNAVTASRSLEREGLPQCGVPDEEESVPNGVLGAQETTEYLSLSMPIKSGDYRLTSVFGPRWGSVHLGSDFAAPAGTPIHAIANGKVIYAGAGKEGRSGTPASTVHGPDGTTVKWCYTHLYPDGVFDAVGDQVKVGDVIGEVGSYGNSTGPHLHLEIHTGNLSDSVGSAVDASAWLKANNATPITTSGDICA